MRLKPIYRRHHPICLVSPVHCCKNAQLLINWFIYMFSFKPNNNHVICCSFLQSEPPVSSTPQAKILATFQSQLKITTCLKPFLSSPQPSNRNKHKLRSYYVAVICDSIVNMTEVSPLSGRGESNGKKEHINY